MRPPGRITTEELWSSLREKLLAWVGRVARNVLTDRYRTEREEASLEVEPSAAEAPDSNLNAEVDGWLRTMLGDLEPG